MDEQLQQKHDALLACLAKMESVVVALSGGIDSSLVAYAAHKALGARALAVTSGSQSLKRDDLDLTRRLTAGWGMAHLVIETDEMSNPNYAANPANRCYFCKSTLYAHLERVARERGFAVVVNGANLDDLSDYRPGMKASAEFSVRSPLLECGFRKADIRALADHLGLPNAAKPQAACLASRVPHGTAISTELLNRIERAERVLAEMGFTQYRVRHHGEVARLELDEREFALAIERRFELTEAVKACGYSFVALDLLGFRSGSMSRAMAPRARGIGG